VYPLPAAERHCALAAVAAYLRCPVCAGRLHPGPGTADTAGMVAARHVAPPVLAARVRALPSLVTATVDVRIRVFQRAAPLDSTGAPDADRHQ
jgi:hypothetical protein